MRKQMLTMLAVVVGFSLGVIIMLPRPASAESLVTTIVVDPLTGVALEGYDAVSYFIDSEPREGLPDYEYVWGGVSWYFANAANRDVFIRSPEVYAPLYGGHCVTSLARGFLSDGKPRIFIIDHLKLYLFYSTANRDAFVLSKSDILTGAAAKWPELSKQLSGATADAPITDPAVATDPGAPPAADASAESGASANPAVAPAPAAGNVTPH